MLELSNQFRFESAHTLERTVDAEPSRRMHGHSYRAEVTVRGEADPSTGMVLDLGLFERALVDAHDGLDHRFWTKFAIWVRLLLKIFLPGFGETYFTLTSPSCALFILQLR